MEIEFIESGKVKKNDLMLDSSAKWLGHWIEKIQWDPCQKKQ